MQQEDNAKLEPPPTVPMWETSASTVMVASCPNEEEAQELSGWTLKKLDERGWCLWRCALLDSNVIVVLRDEMVQGFPSLPAFTRWELHELLDASERSWKMVFEVKKRCPGAWIHGFESPKRRPAGDDDLEEQIFGEGR